MNNKLFQLLSDRLKNKMKDIAALQSWGDMGLSMFPNGTEALSDFACDAGLNRKLVFWRGDITQLSIDAIVNPANEQLMPGGGICGMIHMKAGPQLSQECQRSGRLKPGQSILTDAYKLPCKKVIHAVGPINRKPDLLKATYRSIFELFGGEISSLAIPSISTGVRGFPADDAVAIALAEIRQFMDANKARITKLVIAIDDDNLASVYERELPRFFPVERPHQTEVVILNDEDKEDLPSYIEEEEEEEEDYSDSSTP